MKVQKVIISSDLKELDFCREKVEEFLRKNTKFDKTMIHALVLAIDEAVSNVLVHGFDSTDRKNPSKNTLEIQMEFDKTRFLTKIQDNSSFFNPLEKLPKNEAEQKKMLKKALKHNIQVGKGCGLGIAIYLKIMDKVLYEYDKKRGNILKLIKYL